MLISAASACRETDNAELPCSDCTRLLQDYLSGWYTSCAKKSIVAESYLKLQQEIFMNWQKPAGKRQERLCLVSMN